jgi:hypothetical protein
MPESQWVGHYLFTVNSYSYPPPMNSDWNQQKICVKKPFGGVILFHLEVKFYSVLDYHQEKGMITVLIMVNVT